jgi:hypothetical protein
VILVGACAFAATGIAAAADMPARTARRSIIVISPSLLFYYVELVL